MLEEYSTLLWWLFALSVALFVLTPVAVAWMVVRLPTDYFLEKRRPRRGWELPEAVRPALIVVKNLLGGVLVLAGVVMLVVPGQGLLTIVVGLMLVDFPGKFRVERWLATRPKVWKSINWLRRRAGHDELQRPE